VARRLLRCRSHADFCATVVAGVKPQPSCRNRESSRLASPAAGAIRCRGFTRGVAQLGSALRSGRRGRGFESRHPDWRRCRSQALTGDSGRAFFCLSPQLVRSTVESGLPLVTHGAMTSRTRLASNEARISRSPSVHLPVGSFETTSIRAQPAKRISRTHHLPTRCQFAILAIPRGPIGLTLSRRRRRGTHQRLSERMGVAVSVRAIDAVAGHCAPAATGRFRR
jgi:hypothetical protein